MALFNGVENFVPAFQARQLAIQSGQGAGQSISRGMETARRGKAQQFEQDTFTRSAKESGVMADQMMEARRQQEELDRFMGELDAKLRGRNLGSSQENEWLNFRFGQGSIIPG